MKTHTRYIPSALRWLSFLRTVLLFSLLASGTMANAREELLSSNLVKGAFLINFCKFIEWPSSAFESADAPIVIAIMDAEAMANVLERDEVYTAQGRPVLFVSLEELPENEKFHVLFVNVNSSSLAREAIRKYAGSPILTVGESREFTDWGGMISFNEVNSRLRFEINLKRCKEQGLWLSSQLLALGKVVAAAPVPDSRQLRY